MAIPDFQTVMRPVLAALRGAEARSLAEVRESVAAVLGVSDADRLEMLPSGRQATYDNRVAWAVTHLAQAGLLERPARARYKVSERGEKVLLANPSRVDMTVLSQFPEYVAFRSRKSAKKHTPTAVVVPEEVSPEEAIGEIVQDSYDSLADELVDRIYAHPPAFLEQLALKLLRAMGYGGKEALVEHTGKSGDGGLDGLVRQDALGLDLVGVQAKRYARDSSVMRPEMQAFVGALQGAQTSRGVFVTTAKFSVGARQYAEGVPVRLKLIDGSELGQLLIRYNVGVQVRETYELKQIDEEAFEG